MSDVRARAKNSLRVTWVFLATVSTRACRGVVFCRAHKQIFGKWTRGSSFMRTTRRRFMSARRIQPAPRGERKPTPYLQTPFNEVQGQFSPDGRWIAYFSDDAVQGQFQIYVQSFPPSAGKFQISTGAGGVQPRWRRDGNELFYIAPDGKLMAVEVKTLCSRRADRRNRDCRGTRAPSAVSGSIPGRHTVFRHSPRSHALWLAAPGGQDSQTLSRALLNARVSQRCLAPRSGLEHTPHWLIAKDHLEGKKGEAAGKLPRGI